MKAVPLRASVLGFIVALAAGSGFAQSQRDAEKKLESVRGELKSIAAERRRLEGERGNASRELREADEKVGKSSRALSETEASLRQEQAALAQLQQQRDAAQERLAGQRQQLAALVRSAYRQGGDAPLKALLAQDEVGKARRVLAYHGYLQRERARKMGELTAELQQIEQLEREIAERRAQLDATRSRQKQQVASLQQDRKEQAGVVAELDQKYQDKAAREKALGRDAKSLERLLANLRAAAARAEAARRAEEKRQREAAEREARAAAATGKPVRKPPPPKVANAPALKVGGLGWPASGNLLAGFGGRMPDGRTSSGVLIGAPVGTPVTAVADGTVVFAEWMTGYGLILIVDHGNGYMSLYAHNDTLLRNAGDAVKRGDPVARIGSSGGQGTPALYFELRRNGAPVDPRAWLQRR
ncbi:peptidoglycan DD-metalloendopeptidase family protein [Pseudoxanthomonas helianthi]|uniref:Peptidoglycan DD-metalloendopeptidase family protein n=1 Tax=Pseudoxanthomonas helianthi TaxID=1453541 RepID=A0A940X3P9_9GAMM|nr:peptidoglycan DD-metalloendopeptidase family protein [Pseudoxanthomonas helianthi]MBP3983743.1 peptidoglycan DD-metalloendopeptidase family protein [Pseudoxanthomonas helianthi]